jgi:two-component system, OmpR family, response regulator
MPKILVVDDSGAALYQIRQVLEQHGFEVVTTDSPFAFGQLLGETRPDLALVDVNLPAINGDKLVQLARLSEIPHRCPMVLFTSNDAEQVERMVHRCGAAGFISKQVDSATLIERIREFLSDDVPERSTMRPRWPGSQIA